MEYIFVGEESLHKLSSVIRTYLEDGWEPLGAPFVSKDGELCFQEMVWKK